jgi:hypothetical protein
MKKSHITSRKVDVFCARQEICHPTNYNATAHINRERRTLPWSPPCMVGTSINRERRTLPWSPPCMVGTSIDGMHLHPRELLPTIKECAQAVQQLVLSGGGNQPKHEPKHEGGGKVAQDHMIGICWNWRKDLMNTFSIAGLSTRHVFRSVARQARFKRVRITCSWRSSSRARSVWS